MNLIVSALLDTPWAFLLHHPLVKVLTFLFDQGYFIADFHNIQTCTHPAHTLTRPADWRGVESETDVVLKRLFSAWSLSLSLWLSLTETDECCLCHSVFHPLTTLKSIIDFTVITVHNGTFWQLVHPASNDKLIYITLIKTLTGLSTATAVPWSAHNIST